MRSKLAIALMPPRRQRAASAHGRKSAGIEGARNETLEQACAITMLAIFAGISIILWPAGYRLGEYLAAIDAHPGPATGALILVGVVIPIWGISMIFAGLALYVLSRSFRALYGVVEILAGIGSVAYTFRPAMDQMIQDHVFLPNVVQIVVAIYFLVQGLKDTSAGFRGGTGARKFWDWIFPAAEPEGAINS